MKMLPSIGIFLTAVSAANAAVPDKVSFNQHIRPILSDKCFSCHGLDASHRKGDLRLDTPEGAFADNEGARAIVPGKPEASEAWKRILSTDEEEVMPPPKAHKTLSETERATIKRWIEQGANYQKHWSFEAPVKPVGASSIDSIIAARLERDGLKMAPQADKETLIRRVAFALTGLPPSVAELDAFLVDAAPDAYEKMVERYLASPRYGEEMGRHWLDVARYADTHGLHLDNERQMWAYRDWVVNAFNDNQRFDQFTIDQLAGDQLPNPTQKQLVATGFNRCNVTTGEGGAIESEFTFRYAVERASTTATTWMGLTAGCAQCHDHKFDPLTQKEFYQLYSFFHSAADPAMDGNALLTAPTMKISTADSEKRLAELNTKIAEKEKALEAAAAKLTYTDPAKVQPTPIAKHAENLWFDDEFPPGAKVQSSGHPLKLRTKEQGAQVFSGKVAIKRSGDGMVQDFFTEGSAPLVIPQDAKLFAHVFIDPANPPKMVMLQFNRNGSWDQRAVWGDQTATDWGKAGTKERFNAGPLPEKGKWTRLEIDAEKVGLKAGDSIAGFALTQFAGLVYWDKIGVAGKFDPASDPSRSFLAWWKSNVGKDVKDLPKELAKVLKAGPDKKPAAADEKKLRDFYLLTVCADTKPALAPFAGEVAAAKTQRDEIDKTLPSTFIFRDMEKPRDSFVMMRGVYDKPGDKVVPATPAFLPPLQKQAERATRLDLAKWLVSPEHPLTARVTVNRFWQQFFGWGLVKSSGDFGSQGLPPTHPELLDWLAVSFRESGWDVKALVRKMVTSATFRQASKASPELVQRDPENLLLARGTRIRLDAEQVRDNALFVSGLLNTEMGGKGVRPYQPANIWEPVGYSDSNTRYYKADKGSGLYRRTIYTFFKRTAPPPYMANFDAPNREQSCTMRERSNTPMQALQLMNDTQHVEAARALAQRMLTEGGTEPTARITFAFRTVLSRKPEPSEMAILQRQLAGHLVRYQQDAESAKKLIGVGDSKADAKLDTAQLAAHTLVASTVMNLDETVSRN
jgi:mono/diheme cytochrome c family protein